MQCHGKQPNEVSENERHHRTGKQQSDFHAEGLLEPHAGIDGRRVGAEGAFDEALSDDPEHDHRVDVLAADGLGGVGDQFLDGQSPREWNLEGLSAALRAMGLEVVSVRVSGIAPKHAPAIRTRQRILEQLDRELRWPRFPALPAHCGQRSAQRPTIPGPGANDPKSGSSFGALLAGLTADASADQVLGHPMVKERVREGLVRMKRELAQGPVPSPQIQEGTGPCTRIDVSSFGASGWPSSARVIEGAANGTTVGVTATARDPNGGTVTYTVTGTVNASNEGSVSNTAAVALPPGWTDPTPGNNTNSSTVIGISPPNFSITMLAIPIK